VKENEFDKLDEGLPLPEKVDCMIIDDKFLLNVTVMKESSAADIDLEVTETELKLSSKNYMLTHTFDQKIDADSVKAKFSKKAKTLTLTFKII
jgi:hypothetical protein